jgi:hypothetical protein
MRRTTLAPPLSAFALAAFAFPTDELAALSAQLREAVER